MESTLELRLAAVEQRLDELDAVRAERAQVRRRLGKRLVDLRSRLAELEHQ